MLRSLVRLAPAATTIPTRLPTKKLALSIGVDTYDFYDKLNGCVNDADNVSKLLREMSFEVQTLKNCTRSEIKQACYDLAKKRCEGDLCVFHFSGHGEEDVQQNYLLGKDSRGTSESGGGIKLLEILRELTSPMDNLNDLATVVLLDACRTKRQGRGFRTPDYKIKVPFSVKDRSSWHFLLAADPGQTAAESNGSGVFATSFLKFAKSGDLNYCFKSVWRDMVRSHPADEEPQRPWYYFTGDQDINLSTPVSAQSVVSAGHEGNEQS